MGIFHEQVELINRDCIQRALVYDGQRVYLAPNYNEKGELLKGVNNFVPKICVPYALNQNVVMGSEDPIDPSEFQSHVVPKVKLKKKGRETGEWKYDFSFLPSKTNRAKTRVNLDDYLDDSSLKVLDGRGAFKVNEARVAEGGRGIATQHIDE